MLSELCFPCHKDDVPEANRVTSQSHLNVHCLKDESRRGIIGFLLVVGRVVLNVGLRGTPVLGCSLLLGEEITGHLQLPLISRGV